MSQIVNTATEVLPEAEFLDEIEVLGVFLLAIHSDQSTVNSFALRFLFHATSYSCYNLVTVHCNGEGGKPDRKPYSLSYGLRNP
jgi:hypothetical protein